jgi:hypothetical protein
MSIAAPVDVRPPLQLVPGRECGSCTLCCKVYDIPELDKAAGKWCKHCKPGRGCAIHDSLPDLCSTFNCLWRTKGELPAYWKPEQSKMVVSIYPLTEFIYVQVDPGTPGAWHKQPYYNDLRLWAKNNLPMGIHVIVFVNDVATLIMPDDTVLLGPMKPTDSLVLRTSSRPGMPKYQAMLLPAGAASPQG